MENIKEISAEFIDDPVNPMRSGLDRDGIDELAESIKKQGLINPITVRPVVWCAVHSKRYEDHQIDGTPCAESLRYEVVAGHRRFAACLQARVLKIACVVRELTDDEVFGVMAAENSKRQDIDPVEWALFLNRLMGGDDSRIKQVAESVGFSVQWVEDRLEILNYPDYMIAGLKMGQLKLGVAKLLGRIEDDTYRKMYVDSAINHGMSILQAGYLLTQFQMGILTPSEKIGIVASESPAGPVAKAHAICARCGKMATDPNLKNVFIHAECPVEPNEVVV